MVMSIKEDATWNEEVVCGVVVIVSRCLEIDEGGDYFIWC